MSNDDRFSAEDHYSARPPIKKSSGSGWIFGISGCIAFAVISPFLLVCGCCGGLMHWAMTEEAESIVAAVQADEPIQAEIGEAPSASLNWFASSQAGEDVMIYDVTGEKGSGQLFVYEEGDFPEKIVLHKGDQQWELEFDPLDLTTPSVDDILVGAFSDDPTIQAEIGDINHLEMNWNASMDEDEEYIYIYDVAGDKGKGEIELEFDEDDDTKVIWAKLKKDGHEFDLIISPSKASPKTKAVDNQPVAE